MPISELAKKIAIGKQPTYYTDLLLNHEAIIEAVQETTQGKVAEKLGMTPIKFSAIYNLLVAYKELNNGDT